MSGFRKHPSVHFLYLICLLVTGSRGVWSLSQLSVAPGQVATLTLRDKQPGTFLLLGRSAYRCTTMLPGS